MESLLLVFITILLGVILHSAIHRYQRRVGTVSMRVTLVYVGMFFPLLAGLVYIRSDFFISAILLYSCVSSLLSFLYVGVVLGGETPSSMILHALIRRTHMTEIEIINLFSEDLLIWKRIGDLERSGLIVWHDGRLMATEKGRLIVSIVSAYEYVFHRSHGG